MGHYYIDPDHIPKDQVKYYEAKTCTHCSGSGKVPGPVDDDGRGESNWCGNCGGGGSIYVRDRKNPMGQKLYGGKTIKVTCDGIFYVEGTPDDRCMSWTDKDGTEVRILEYLDFAKNSHDAKWLLSAIEEKNARSV